jgi:hypothetical protein
MIMKARTVQSIIYLVFCSLFAHQAWAADWIFHTASVKGDMYYNKSSIKQVKKNSRYVHTKIIYSEDEKKETFLTLKSMAKAPKDPGMLSHALILFEVDCLNEKMKDFFTVIYDKKGDVIYWSTKGNAGQWKNIRPNSVNEKLENIVCGNDVAPDKAVVVPAVTDKKPDQDHRKQNETTAIAEAPVLKLVTKWLASWQAGDMDIYRSCYASDFKAKGMNLDAWIAYKTRVSRKSKNIDIRINKLQITAEENYATAIFTQYYSSSIFKDSGIKKLELRRINNEWGIYRESM